MADSSAKQEKRTGRPKLLTDSGRKRKKKELDAKRGKSRISIGEELERWTALKERLGLNSHAEVAKVLLDRFELEVEDKASASKYLKTSTPACKDVRRSYPDISEISSDSDARVSGMSGIEVLSDAELGKQQFLKPGIPPNSKPEVSSSFINPFDLTMELSEDHDDEHDNSDEDYEPSINLTIRYLLYN